jgi:hypothetical protein
VVKVSERIVARGLGVGQRVFGEINRLRCCGRQLHSLGYGCQGIMPGPQQPQRDEKDERSTGAGTPCGL